MKDAPATYLSSAIQRIESGVVDGSSGSHIAGIFGKAAKDFEKAIRSYLASLVATCGLSYDTQIRPVIKGRPSFDKLTLGNCVAAIGEVSRRSSARVADAVPVGWNLGDFLQVLGKINSTWVDVKHGDGVGPSVLLAQMKSMLSVYQALKRGPAAP